LQRVVQLQERLNRLDAEALPSASLRQESMVDLDRYKVDVGSDGQDVVRWQGRIDAAVTAIATLRTTLGELDKSEVVSTAQAERLSPSLTQLLHAAGESDEDVKRWQARLSTSRDRIGQLRNNLAALNTSDSLITLVSLAALQRDLEALVLLVGKDDEQARSWNVAMLARQERLKSMRENLSRLNPVDWATTSLQTTTSKDLATYEKIAEANDADLISWKLKIANSVARISNLRGSLARLDLPEALTVVERDLAGKQLADYGALVSQDDGQLQAWQARLNAERNAEAAMLETLKRFEKESRMTVVELDACTKSVTTLGRLGALPEAKQRLYERRLTEERQYIETLRQSLTARDGVEVVIDQALVVDLNTLAKIAGENDEVVKRWRTRVNDYERLRNILITLDSAEPLPQDVEKYLTAYAAIVGPASVEVKRWRSKIARVNELLKYLAPLATVAPLPEDALNKAQALVAEVGEKDLQAGPYLAKAKRVASLIDELTRSLEQAYVLPSNAVRQRRDLIALVGTMDEQVAALVTRVTILEGPGQPAWASASGRDNFGLWAEVTLNGVTQRFRYIPAGEFMMGSPESESGRGRDETQVRVTLSRSFWLADTECSQEFWTAVAEKNDSRFAGDENPVERISWDEARAFCTTLSTKVSGMIARLPREAEWEYACRAGVTGPYACHTGIVTLDKLDTIAWFKGTTATTQGVKRRFGNALGLFDMHGNVWEWCEDRYGTYSPTAVIDPIGREQETRVARGGSWGDAPVSLRAANRLSIRQDMRTLYVGLRLAVAVQWPNGQDPSAATFILQQENSAGKP
jgi:formylglycine-generating enzyme required for sulfatase activity/succinate dehydrogenase flavin-adding protein (antitoxin of CptAB toxin-antitoxin module)